MSGFKGANTTEEAVTIFNKVLKKYNYVVDIDIITEDGIIEEEFDDLDVEEEFDESKYTEDIDVDEGEGGGGDMDFDFD